MARMSGLKTERSGREKAAMLLISLGPERSAEIFKHLKEEEIEQLTLEIANIRTVTPEEKEKVMEEFYQICLAQETLPRAVSAMQRKSSRRRWERKKPLTLSTS